MRRHLCFSILFFTVILVVGLCPAFSTAQTAAPAGASAGVPVVDPSVSGPSPIEGAWRLENGKVFCSGETEQEVSLPAPALALQLVDGGALVALGDAGVAHLRVDESGKPAVVGIIPVSQGAVTGFAELDDGIWLKVTNESMVRFKSGGMGTKANVSTITPVDAPGSPLRVPPVPLEAPKPSFISSDAAPAFSQTVTVTDVRHGTARLSGGSLHGVRTGQYLHVYRVVDAGNRNESFMAEVQVATLVVSAVNESSSMAQIWRGDKVLVGDTVRPAKNKDDVSLAYPRQFNNIWELEFNLRPVISVDGDGGFAMVNDAHLTWTGKYYYAGLRMQPVRFGFENGDTAFAGNFAAEGGFNHRALALGIGLGVAAINGNLASVLGGGESYYDDTTGAYQYNDTGGAGFSISQTVRLGATDGIHFVATNLLVYTDGEFESGFSWAGVNGRFSFPVGKRMDMFLEGGGGPLGFGYGAVGLFAWIVGNGDAGSIGLSAALGGAGIWQESENDDAYGYDCEFDNSCHLSIGGPMFALGARFRFGRGTLSR